ncbi:MAG: hypothetical protein ACFFCS_28550 [Candidatus Hodarchaeota archaeon]
MGYEIFCLYIDGLEFDPQKTHVRELVNIYDSREIAQIATVPDWEKQVSKNMQKELKQRGQFSISFKPTIPFLITIQDCFKQAFGEEWSIYWGNAGGGDDNFTVGFGVGSGKNPQWLWYKIKSKLIVLRVIFQYSGIETAFPVFMEKMSKEYSDLIENIELLWSVKLNFGYYIED